MAKSFPEPNHSKHAPSEDAGPHHIKKSEHTDAGHMDHDGRMPHPFGADWHSGEVKPSDNFGKGGSYSQHEE